MARKSDIYSAIGKQLRALNRAQRGSFGEFLFEPVAKKNLDPHVVAVRRNNVDFIVGRIQVGVKARIRDLDRQLPPLKPYRGNRIKNVSYAQVEFAREGARVSLEQKKLAMLRWPQIDAKWQAWERIRPRTPPIAGNIKPLRNRIINRFHHFGFRARVIYRTCQAQFGKESPQNLLPSPPQRDRLTVFLDFRSSRLAENNIRRIIAFPDTAANSMSYLKQTRLHRRKVDLSHVPDQFVFTSLSKLIKKAKQLTDSISG